MHLAVTDEVEEVCWHPPILGEQARGGAGAAGRLLFHDLENPHPRLGRHP